jgi:gamma-glutamyl hercynylcysteine S-oxide synthase
VNSRKEALREGLAAVRERTLWLLDQVPEEFLRRRVHWFYSPVGWHFGHVGRTEEYWAAHRAAGRPLLDDHLSFMFEDRPDNPKDNRVNIPDREGIRAYMARTRDLTLDALEDADLASDDPMLRDGFAWEFALQHECQHQETIAEMLQLIHLQRFRQGEFDWPEPLPWRPGVQPEMLEVSGGTFCMGSDDLHHYDNERDPHEVRVEPFRIARHPVTAYEWSRFVLDGGYRGREFWSDEGWAWRCTEDAALPEYWAKRDGRWFAIGPQGLRALHPDEPAASVSWHEAQAFARWSGRRLPTEAEWEFVAAGGAEGRFFPWGDAHPQPEHGVYGLESWGPKPVGEHPSGASRIGAEDLAGNVWEWTSSPFLPYHGFEAFPYDGYSKDHMKGEHRVCRGGSWATAAPILRRSFRNWYVPGYRAGFLGLRLAD